jgi:hypothetical protein
MAIRSMSEQPPIIYRIRFNKLTQRYQVCIYLETIMLWKASGYTSFMAAIYAAQRYQRKIEKTDPRQN